MMPRDYRYVVPTSMLADYLEPAIERVNAELVTGTGARTLIAQRASHSMGISPSSVPRRLWDITERDTYKTAASMADALLLATDIHIEDTNIPTLADGYDAATEMVQAYFQETADKQRRFDKGKLATSLYRISQGFLLGLGLEPEEIIAKQKSREEDIERRRERRKVAA